MKFELNTDEKDWLILCTRRAMARTLPDGASCMMPGCGKPAKGRLPLFSVPTRFETELHLCTRCYEMLTTAPGDQVTR